MSAHVSFSATDAGLRSAVRDLRGRFASGNQAMLEVNQNSLKYLKGRSAGILKNSIQREKDFRSKRGLGVVADDAAHKVGIDAFSFWVIDQIDAVDRRVRSYYRAIDQGSDYWVESGREVALVFYPGSPVKPARGGGFQAAYASPVGARVRITKPIPAYGFLTIPVRDFRQEGLYGQYVKAAFERRGLKVNVRTTP